MDLEQMWAQIVAAARQDPGYHAPSDLASRGGINSGVDIGLTDDQLTNAARRLGIQIPEGYHLDPQQGPVLVRNSNAGNLARQLGTAAAFVGPAAIMGALSAPAAGASTAAAGGGAALPAETIGLAGSGFGAAPLGTSVIGTAGGAAAGAGALASTPIGTGAIGPIAGTPSGILSGGSAAIGGSTAGHSLVNSLLKPEVLGPAIGGGFNLAGSVLQANASKHNAELQNQLTRDVSYLNSLQQNPYTQQEDAFRASALASLSQHGPSRLGQSTPFDLSQAQGFLAPSAMEGAYTRFRQAQNVLDPQMASPTIDLGQAGFQSHPQMGGPVANNAPPGGTWTNPNQSSFVSPKVGLANQIVGSGQAAPSPNGGFGQAFDYFTRRPQGGY